MCRARAWRMDEPWGAIVTPMPTAPALHVSSVRHTHASCAHVVLFFAFRRQMRRWSCAASASVDVAGRLSERTSRTRRGASTGSTRVVRTGSLEVGFKRAVAAGLEAKHHLVTNTDAHASVARRSRVAWWT